jgi:hypothetical protein
VSRGIGPGGRVTRSTGFPHQHSPAAYVGQPRAWHRMKCSCALVATLSQREGPVYPMSGDMGLCARRHSQGVVSV